MQYLENGGLLTEAENSGKDINEILGESEESLSGSRQEYLNAMADSVGSVYTLTIHYQDENGNTLADDYIAQYVEGEKFSIQSPEVYGYIPNYSIITSNDQSITETQGMPSRDLEITVKYSKTAEVPEWNKNPNLSVIKEIISTPKNGTSYAAGEKITYRLTVTNTGNVTIEKFRIEDKVTSNSGGQQYTFTKFTDPKDQTYLEAGATGYIDYTYTVQKADLGGTIKNTAELAETVPPVPSGHKIPPVEIPTTPTVNVSVIKKWKEHMLATEFTNPPEGTKVEIILSINDEPTEKTLILSDENNWQGEFSNLPMYDKDGDEIDYGIYEYFGEVEGVSYLYGHQTEISKNNFVLVNYLGNPPQPVDPVDPDPTDPEDPSPVDPAPRSYTLTVYYYDVETGDEVNGSYTEKHSYGDSYTVTVPEIEGYTYDHSVGATSGKITRDEIIMIYYMADVDLPDE